jgi:hypothetical protein
MIPDSFSLRRHVFCADGFVVQVLEEAHKLIVADKLAMSSADVQVRWRVQGL